MKKNAVSTIAKKKTLTLTSESIKALADDRLPSVAGGMPAITRSVCDFTCFLRTC